MLTKIRAALAFALVVLLALLTAEGAARLPSSGALLFVPKTQEQEGFEPAALADALDGKLVYTYESQTAAVLRTALRTAQATLYSVNHSYPQVMGLPLAAGSFFTQNAEKERARHIVLNEHAAFTLFGGVNAAGMTLTLGDKTWEVVGVLADGLDSPAAYAPAIVTGGAAQAFAALPDKANGISAAHVLSLLKQAGITSDGFRVADAGKLSAQPLGKALFAGSVLAVLTLVFLFARCIQGLRGLFAALRARYARFYPAELLTREPLLLLRTLLCLLAAIALAVGAFALFLAWMNLFLIYEPVRYAAEWSAYALPQLSAVLAPLCAANGRGTLLLALAACSAVCLCIAFLPANRREG